MSDFEGVVAPLNTALQAKGYDTLTPVQQAVIAPEHAGADMLVSAQTGSGKTVAFGLALAPTLLEGKDRFSKAGAPLALAIAPTRELALQVKRELQWLYAETGAKIASCVGGMDMQGERKALNRGVHIVVGTPGRLVDHIKRGSLDLSELAALVLDEADEMLDMGFRDELEEIMRVAPHDRRTLLFSATVPNSIATMAKKYQNDAVRINTVSSKEQHVDIEYRALTVHADDRENAIINVLRYYEAKNALVFCSTRAAVNRMTSRFNNRGFSVVALSGELSQKERTNALQSMRDGRARVCIATDVAARGLDLPNLELVIHADMPKNREGLLHRSGRTGRAGRKGVSVVIVPLKGQKRADRLLRSAGVSATWDTPPSKQDIIKRDEVRLLEDPSLSAEMSESEKEFAITLVERFGPEQMAAAFVRLYKSGQSAPEELRGVSKQLADKKNLREDFKDGVWFKLSIGRKQNAEPRWLLPLFINEAGLNKKDIGSIKIAQSETYVELAPKCVEQFLSVIGDEMLLEENISVVRMDKRPENIDTRGGSSRPRGERPRKEHRDRNDRKDKKPYAKKPYDKKPYAKKKPGGEKDSSESYDKEGSASLYDPDFWEGQDGDKPPKRKKTKPRKPHKKKLARAAAKAAGKKSGDQGAKLKRKKRDPKK
ncbi:MAG: DEAD/DEAH box helicase [Robiginitomaculum sp.]|nr:DEAD/DEAH box helicase [Robiginitomaculum sp.]